MYDHHKFLRLTGTTFYPPHLEELGIPNDDIGASFYPHNVDVLLRFCAANPQYHVVSCVGGGLYVNRYDVRGIGFQLADGDNNPELELDARAFLEWFVPSLLGAIRNGDIS